MSGTTSTALPSHSHDQHYKTDAAKRKGGGSVKDCRVLTEYVILCLVFLSELIDVISCTDVLNIYLLLSVLLHMCDS